MSYIMPKSLTWWGGVAMLLSGIIMALTAAFPSLQPLTNLLGQVYHGLGPGELVNVGLVVIGFRKAVATGG